MSNLGDLSDYLSAFVPTYSTPMSAKMQGPVQGSSAARDAACNPTSEFFDAATCRRLGGVVISMDTLRKGVPVPGAGPAPSPGPGPGASDPGPGPGASDPGPGPGAGDGRGGGGKPSESTFPWWLILVAAGAYYYSQRR